MSATRVSVLGLVLLTACGTITTGPPREPAVPGQAMASWVVELEGRQAHELYARNDTLVIQRITGITLRDCTNVKEACGSHQVDVILCPAESRRVFTVHPLTVMDRIYFNWSYSARVYEPDEPVVGANCAGDGP